MSGDYYVWSCPVKKIAKCNVSPRLIESQFTVSTRRSFAIKRTESPLYPLSSKSNKFAILESKRDLRAKRQFSVPKQRYSRQDLQNNECDKQSETTKKKVEIKNFKTVRIRSPSSRKSKSRTRQLSTHANRSIQTDHQGVLSHFTSMVDGIGTAVVDTAAPWIPYVGATVLAIVLLGYFSKKVEKALCIYNTANELMSTFQLNDIPLMDEEPPANESSTPELPSNIGATVDPDTLRFHYNKLKWPQDPMAHK